VQETRDQARSFAASVAREVEKLVGVTFDISAARAEDIRRALKSGVTPTFTRIRRSNATRLRAPTPKATRGGQDDGR
jgi:hypothetical protein